MFTCRSTSPWQTERENGELHLCQNSGLAAAHNDCPCRNCSPWDRYAQANETRSACVKSQLICSFVRNSAISERKSCSLHTPGTRSGCKHRDAPPGDYFNGILNTELPALPLNEPSICRRHTSVKMARLTNFDGKGVQFFLLINH